MNIVSVEGAVLCFLVVSVLHRITLASVGLSRVSGVGRVSEDGRRQA